MVTIGYVLAGLVAAAIIFIGARFLLAPATAASGYGVPLRGSPTTDYPTWLAVKGVRDIVSGLFTILLMVDGTPRLLGEFLIIASLIAFSDGAIVLRSGGSRSAAFGIHGCTALFLLIAGAILIATSR